jgi:IS5 family transposase
VSGGAGQGEVIDFAENDPFDGHTLGPVVTELETLTGVETRRIHVDKGYRGHNHQEKFRVWIIGQARRVTAPIRREMKRRAAVEPVIGHVKVEHRTGRDSHQCGAGRREIQFRSSQSLRRFFVNIRW